MYQRSTVTTKAVSTFNSHFSTLETNQQSALPPNAIQNKMTKYPNIGFWLDEFLEFIVICSLNFLLAQRVIQRFEMATVGTDPTAHWQAYKTQMAELS